MAYASISIEGGLFPSDLLDRIAAGESSLPGQKATDFGIDGSRRLTDEIQAAFSDARSYWDAFQRRLERSRESRTTITREDWVTKFLELVGFEHLVVQRASAEVGDERYFISHRAGDYPEAAPVHIVSIDQDLDHRDGRRSPHAMLQEYLNRSDSLWGMVTNGRELRLLRDTARLSKPTYLEFDLQAMIGGNLYSEFVLLYRLVHASRFPRKGIDPHESLVEQYYQQGIDEGGRVREDMRKGVEAALRILGTAFLAHPQSEALRRKVQTGQLDATGYYRQLLRLVYRFLFLMVFEERRLIFPPDVTGTHRQAIYSKYYGVARLRDRADRYFAGDRHSDLWLGMKETFRVLQDNDAAGFLGLSALNGELFNSLVCADLEASHCTNEELLGALRDLSTFRDDGGQRRRVNYAGLDVEEFGSVYESLLDFHPRVSLQPPGFDLVAGSERKQTGSYYTPPELVRELIESALVPVVQDRLRGLKTPQEREAALLNLRICDPASGSGHFLLAAARRVARELATVRSREEEPSPQEYRRALRDVIRHCVYAVDKNPLAVDLCKVALWIEGHSAGLPLSFLDHHIKCGDSLVGVADLRALEQDIPDEAYNPVTGDDKGAARHYLSRNREERKSQRQLYLGESGILAGVPEALAEEFQTLAGLEERTPDDVHAKESLYNSVRQQDTDWWRLKVACDLWTAAFFLPLRQEDALNQEGAPTTGTLRRHLQTNSAHPTVVGQAVATSVEHPFFHWPLEFPEVFERGGFDVVLGNPPWELLQPEEIKFFGVHAPEIGELSGARRKAVIEKLHDEDPHTAQLWDEYRRAIECEIKFVRGSRRFERTAKGKINTYSAFAELMLHLLDKNGRLGTVLPSGIVSDYSNSDFCEYLVSGGHLVEVVDFGNSKGIFKSVQKNERFCLLTAGNEKNQDFSITSQIDDYSMIHVQSKRYQLSPENVVLFNPNTKGIPFFYSTRDFQIALNVYKKFPVLSDLNTQENPWQVDIRQGLFNMTSDSDLFSRSPLNGYAPLLEAKLVNQFNHRAATFEGIPEHQRFGIHAGTNTVGIAYLNDPNYSVIPRYWIPRRELDARLDVSIKWAVVFRNIISTVADSRSLNACVVPRTGVGNSISVIASSLPEMFLLCPALNSYMMDYILRQKAGGSNLNIFIIRQLPFPLPSYFVEVTSWSADDSRIEWIRPRVLELIYTAWDLKSFAQDLGYNGAPFRWDVERRFLIRCELDAAFFHLYGIERDDVGYIMETFPIVKRKDEQQYGEYRTKRVILELYDKMALAIRTGQPYCTRLNPPPADPRVAHEMAKGVV